MEMDQPDFQDNRLEIAASPQFQVPEVEMVDITTTTGSETSSPRSIFYQPSSSTGSASDVQNIEVDDNDADSLQYADSSLQLSQTFQFPYIPECFQDDVVILITMPEKECTLRAHQPISGEDDDINTIILQQYDDSSDKNFELLNTLQASRDNYNWTGESNQSVEQPVMQPIIDTRPHEGNSPPCVPYAYSESAFDVPSCRREGSTRLQSSQGPPLTNSEDNAGSSAFVTEVSTCGGEASGSVEQSLNVQIDGASRSDILAANGRRRQPHMAIHGQRIRWTENLPSVTELSLPEAASKDQLLTYLLEKKLTLTDLLHHDNKSQAPKVIRVIKTGCETIMEICQEVKRFEVGSSSHDNISDPAKEPDLNRQALDKEEHERPTHACKIDSEAAAIDEIDKCEIAAAVEMSMGIKGCEVDISMYEELEDITQLSLTDIYSESEVQMLIEYACRHLM